MSSIFVGFEDDIITQGQNILVSPSGIHAIAPSLPRTVRWAHEFEYMNMRQKNRVFIYGTTKPSLVLVPVYDAD